MHLHLGWSDISDNAIAVVQEKTGIKLWVPVHRNLRAILATIPKRSVRILSNTAGVPWTKDGFKSSWANQMKRLAADGSETFRDLVFHGLRKSAVVFLLEAGCSVAQVRSVTGQSMQMVEHYARDVNQRKLAAEAILQWEEDARSTKNEQALEFVQPVPNLVQRAAKDAD